MRRFLSRELLKRFNVAWGFLCEDEQVILRKFIRSVRADDEISSIKFWTPDNGRHGPDQNGVAWCGYYGRELDGCGFIALSTELERSATKVLAIATILHELAHALHYAHASKILMELPDAQAEQAAWTQAGAWAAFNMSNYSRNHEVASLALGKAIYHMNEWTHKKMFKKIGTAILEGAENK